MATITSAVSVFVVSLIIGAIGIYSGARLLVDQDTSIWKALITALIGAIVWAVVAFFVGWIPLLGPILLLIVWVGVVNWQYPGGWVNAAGIGITSWIVALIIIYVLGKIGIVGLKAIGIPGV